MTQGFDIGVGIRQDATEETTREKTTRGRKRTATPASRARRVRVSRARPSMFLRRAASSLVSTASSSTTTPLRRSSEVLLGTATTTTNGVAARSASTLCVPRRTIRRFFSARSDARARSFFATTTTTTRSIERIPVRLTSFKATKTDFQRVFWNVCRTKILDGSVWCVLAANLKFRLFPPRTTRTNERTGD